MSEDQERREGLAGADERVALPLCRADLDEGLRSVHEALTAAQEESQKVVAQVRALAAALIEKGIVRPHELNAISTASCASRWRRNPWCACAWPAHATNTLRPVRSTSTAPA